MLKEKICAIDLDGTILDSSERHYMVLNDVLSEIGITANFDKECFLSYKASGNSTKQFCRDYLQLGAKETSKVCNEWMRQIEEKKYMQYDKLYEDSISFLDWAVDSFQGVVLITARSRKEETKKQVNRLGIERYFNEIFITNPNQAFNGKKEIISQLLQKGQVLIIGDSEVEHSVSMELCIPEYILHSGFRNKIYWDSHSVKSYESLREVQDAICLKE